MSAQTTRYEVSGLESPVEILIDMYGVPHLYAESTRDLYLAQGFNATRDRLWQIDLGRRSGLGLLSEVFGPDFLERDRAARLVLYRGDLDAEWAAYGEGIHEACGRALSAISARTSKISVPCASRSARSRCRKDWT